jgi:hypothetical protein
MTNRVWIFAAMLVAACATTQLKDTWKDPAFTGPPLKKIFVVGVSKSDANRRVFEDGFARALTASGSNGVASYATLSEGGPEVTHEQVNAAMKRAGADGVLVTRLLRARRDVSVSPGFAQPGFYGRGFRGYYGGAYMATPDVNVYDVLTIESTLWNMQTDKPVWSGTSEVTEPKNVAAATEELAKILITKMKADGVI